MSRTITASLFCFFIGLIALAGFIGCKVNSSSGGFAKNNLNKNELTYSNAGIATAAGFANTQGISPTWSLTSSVGITYSIAASSTDGSTSDGSGSAIIIDSATGVVTITDTAIVGNSGKYTVTATAGSTSPDYANGSTQTAEITVTVHSEKITLDTVALSYNPQEIAAVQGTASTASISPAWNLAPSVGITYSIAASSNGGPASDGSNSEISIVPATGEITITDTAIVDNSGKYSVTATAGITSPLYKNGSTQTAEITVTVSRGKVALDTITLTYSNSEITSTAGNANTQGISPHMEPDFLRWHFLQHCSQFN